jgi:hypothetical protein
MPQLDLSAPYRSEAFAEDLPTPPSWQGQPSTSSSRPALLRALPVCITLVAVIALVIGLPA